MVNQTSSSGVNDLLSFGPLNEEVILNTLDGRDTIELTGITGTINIDTGDDRDRITIASSDAGALPLSINTGAGSDWTELDGVTAAGGVYFNAGSGGRDTIFTSLVNGNVTLNMTQTDESLSILNFINGSLTFNGVSGRNVLLAGLMPMASTIF